MFVMSNSIHILIPCLHYVCHLQVSQDSKLLKSSSTCIISIDHYIYKQIICTESHVFQPFSNQNAGAMTLVKQSLVLVEEQSKELDDQAFIDRRTTLGYDPIPTPKPLTDELKLSRDLIKKLCQLSGKEVQIEFSDLFTKFIHTARYLSYNVLNVLYRRAGSICPTGKYVLFLNVYRKQLINFNEDADVPLFLMAEEKQILRLYINAMRVFRCCSDFLICFRNVPFFSKQIQ